MGIATRAAYGEVLKTEIYKNPKVSRPGSRDLGSAYQIDKL